MNNEPPPFFLLIFQFSSPISLETTSPLVAFLFTLSRSQPQTGGGALLTYFVCAKWESETRSEDLKQVKFCRLSTIGWITRSLQAAKNGAVR